MKLLLVNDQFERGGAGRVAAIMCNGFYSEGIDITVATDKLHWHDTYKINSNIPIVDIDTKSCGNRFFKWLKCSKKIRCYVKNYRPDCIIAVQSMMFFVTWLACLGLKVPIIAADHTSFSRKIHPLIDFIRYHLYSRASALSILTKKDERLLGEKFPNKRVIYNPLSFPVLQCKKLRKKTILCVGRFESWHVKGFDIIFDVWEKIHEKYPEWLLEIAGSGDQKFQGEILEMISQRNILHRVKLLGHVDNMKDLYSETSIFVLCSRTEGFPMVLMEAMSQGCACIAFSVGGATEEMMSKDSGLLIPDNDILGLSNALEKLISDDLQRLNFSKNAMSEVARFSEESFIDNWLKLLKNTIKK